MTTVTHIQTSAENQSTRAPQINLSQTRIHFAAPTHCRRRTPPRLGLMGGLVGRR